MRVRASARPCKQTRMPCRGGPVHRCGSATATMQLSPGRVARIASAIARTAAVSRETRLSSTATMAMAEWRCSSSMRLAVATGVVQPCFAASASNPPVERGFLHGNAFEPILERAPQARRDRDVGKNLQAPGSGALGTAGTSSGGVADRAGARAQHGFRRPGIDPEVADEPVQRYAVLEPVEELLNGQAGAPEAGGHRSCARDPPRPASSSDMGGSGSVLASVVMAVAVCGRELNPESTCPGVGVSTNPMNSGLGSIQRRIANALAVVVPDPTASWNALCRRLGLRGTRRTGRPPACAPRPCRAPARPSRRLRCPPAGASPAPAPSRPG